jgi:hypothetical protein
MEELKTESEKDSSIKEQDDNEKWVKKE